MARQRMSSVDTAWLRMDSASNLMMIVGVMMFDAVIDRARLARVIEARLLIYPRFRQRVEDDGVAAYWVDHETFDLDAHLSTVRLPGKADDKALQALVAKLAAEPLDRARPLWQIHLVENHRGGSALIARLHHCIADGIALIGVLLNLTDTQPDADDAPRKLPDRAAKRMAFASAEALLRALGPLGAGLQSLLQPGLPALSRLQPLAEQALHVLGPLRAPFEEAVDQSVKIGNRMVAKYSRWVADPTEAMDAARMASGVARELAYLATMPHDTPTRLKGVPGTAKRVAWSQPISLARVKDVGYVLGASVNDVLLASVAGAIRRYLIAKGDRVDPDARLRAFVPVNLRPQGREHELGNHFGLVGLELPIGLANPIERVFAVRSRMHALKHGYQAVVTMALLGMLGYLPQAVQRQALGLLSDKGSAVMTNVPGPSEPLYLAGCRIMQTMFWVPQSGNLGVGVSILSYAGGVQFGLITDARLCPDPEVVIAGFEPEFERLLTALMWIERGRVEEVAAAFDAYFAKLDDPVATTVPGPKAMRTRQ